MWLLFFIIGNIFWKISRIWFDFIFTNKSIVKCISNSIDAEEFEQFSEKLFGKLESEIVTIKNQIISDFDFLLSKGLIEIVEDNESNENSNIAVSNFNKKVSAV